MTTTDLDTGHMRTHYTQRTPVRTATGHPAILVEPKTGSGYESEVDVVRGEVTALAHSRFAADEIAGSEVIVGQYRLMASLKGVEAAPLRRLIRSNVISTSGQPVIEYLHGTSEHVATPKEFLPGTEGFLALLGIENLSSAVFLVTQRGPELGIRGIEKIRLTASRSLFISYLVIDRVSN